MAAIFADAISATDHLGLFEFSALNGLCNRKADFYESAIRSPALLDHGQGV
jgi:hypothetical protein